MFPETMADKGPIKLTLADIAERAGVSRSLASLALRGEPGVQREKRARILKIAAELNYTPNPAARNLASNLSPLSNCFFNFEPHSPNAASSCVPGNALERSKMA